jgi:hypothetical protein
MSDALQTGLAAGQAAYNGATPKKRMGLSAADLSSVNTSVNSGLQTAAAQRQMVDTNAEKQAAGKYTTSGTSGALYNYMHDRGGYPVTPVPSNTPVVPNTSSIYSPLPGVVTPKVDDTKTKVSTPYDPNDQTKIAKDAVTNPTKMGTVTKSAIPQTTAMQQLMSIASPALLGYYALNKTGGLDALSNLYNTGATYFNTPSAYAAGQAAQDAAFIPNVGGNVLNVSPASAVESISNPVYDFGPPPVASETVAPVVDAATRGISTAAPAADFGDMGLNAAGRGVPDVAQEQLAEKLAAEKLAEEEATKLAAEKLAAEEAAKAEAARVAAAGGDDALVEAASNTADESMFSGLGDILSSAWDYISSDPVGFLSSWIFKEGGQVGNSGLAAAYANGGMARGGSAHQPFFSKSTGKFNYTGPKVYADGGISVGSRYDPNIDGISQAAPDVSFQPTVGRFASGGISHLGGYSDGGRLLRGPGDGVSDSIPATIGGKQPARLADGEFVVPARIVSEIGNGSTEAGARKLYAMMDRVQAARGQTVGKGKVAKNTRADKYLPK